VTTPLLGLWWALLSGCGKSVDCTTSEAATVLAEAGEEQLTCGDVAIFERYTELLAGRPMRAGSNRAAAARLKESFASDVGATRVVLSQLSDAGALLETATGRPAAALRMAAIRDLSGSGGPLSGDQELARIALSDVVLYKRSEGDRYLLTEMDIEGWIFYASLCREVQGASPLRLSVADRVQVYRMVEERFELGDDERRRALTSVGPFWYQVKEAWARASYAKQREWVEEAPLPPPMEATSLGYFEAVVDGDIPGHASALHSVFGPLGLSAKEPFFTAEDGPPGTAIIGSPGDIE